MSEKGKFGGYFAPEGSNDDTQPIADQAKSIPNASGAQVDPAKEYNNAAMLEVGEHDSLEKQRGIPPEDV